MAIGDEEREIIDLVDWADLYARNDDSDAIIADLAFRGRWTAIASPAKAGKSTAILALAVEAAREGAIVLYLDAEMGRTDVLDRVEDWMHLKPDDLANLHYSDLPPKLDTVEGATRLWHTVETVNPDLVIIDSLNGVVNGAENDDTTWRDMYEWAIAPLKQRNVAVISADNHGKDRALGPRGSSVKLDKADAVLMLERTDDGCKLTATHRRTASYPTEQAYILANVGEEGPPMTIQRSDGGGGSYPAGTKRIAAILDDLGAPIDISRREASRLLKDHGETPGRSQVLGQMLKWRREQVERQVESQLGGSQITGTSGNHGNHPFGEVVPDPGNQCPSTRGSRPGTYLGTGLPEEPPEDSSNAGTTGEPPEAHKDPFA
jgi:hypothetical protein